MKPAALLGLALLLSCARPIDGGVVVRYRQVTYSAVVPTADLRAGEQVRVSWQPRDLAASAEPQAASIRLCAALVGPFASVEALKGRQAAGTPSCPADERGVAVRSDVLETDSREGRPQETWLFLPASLAAGYYDLVTIATATGGKGGDSMRAGSVVRVAP